MCPSDLAPQASDWTRSLQAGERVRVSGSQRSLPALAVRTLAVGLYVVLLAVVYSRSLFPPSSLWAVLFVVSGSLMIAFFSWRLVIAWGTFLRSAIQFTNQHLDFWDWRGGVHQIALEDVIALRSLPWSCGVCHTASKGSKPRWILFQGMDRKLADAVKKEIVRRCTLMEAFGGVWQRTIEGEPPPVPWWEG
jgi:hypothetical protein